MPYTAPFFYFVIGGELRAGTTEVDRWQIGLKVPLAGAEVEPTDSAMDGLLNDTETDAKAWWAVHKSYCGSQVTLATVKVNKIGTDGKYVNKAKTWRKDFTPIGGSATQSLPADVAVVVTLETGAQRGLASKGRVYLPPVSTNLVVDGRMAASTTAAIADAFAGLVRDIGNLPGVDATPGWGAGDVSVMSDVREGATRTVTGVAVGDLFDTQRRRSNNMRELYTRRPIPAPTAD